MNQAFRFTLADDDDKFLYIMHHLLVKNFPGSSISSFSNPGDALKHVLRFGSDVLITDHGMGGLTGTDLIRELRKQHRALPIIMVSGDASAETEALEAGANEFLHKDAVMRHLAERIKNYLSK